MLPRTRARRASRRERVHPQVASSADPVLLVFLEQRAYRPASISACSPGSRIRAGRSSCEPTTSCTHSVVSRILSGRVGEGLVYCLVGQDGEGVAFRQWRRHSCYRPRRSGHGRRTEGPRHRPRYRHSPSIVGARGSVRNPHPPQTAPRRRGSNQESAAEQAGPDLALRTLNEDLDAVAPEARTPRNDRSRSEASCYPEWSQPGSNRRPPACKAGALPTELWPLAE